jgi:hypothetical protein
MVSEKKLFNDHIVYDATYNALWKIHYIDREEVSDFHELGMVLENR